MTNNINRYDLFLIGVAYDPSCFEFENVNCLILQETDFFFNIIDE